ncbi:MAG TPA: tetratricopeptide repeat protein, partial [Planctomycetaceae bacterium]
PAPGGGRPAVGPGTGGARPGVGGSGVATRPAQPGGDRPRVSAYPAGGSRPATGDRPIAGNQPGLAGRPGSPSRPGSGLGATAGLGAAAGIGAAAGAGLSDRAAAGDRLGRGERPTTLPAERPGPDGRPANLPGLGERPGAPGVGGRPGEGDRFANRDTRRDDLQNRLASRDDNQGDRLDNREDRQDLRGDRRDDRQNDRQNDRQDFRDGRQDFREDRREDWQDWADDRDWVYHGWHHGYWHGYGEGWWDHMWEEHPAAAALGLTTWGLNRAGYAFGVWGYTNPYYVEPITVGSTVIDYSQPLIVGESYPVEEPVEVPVDSAAPGGPSQAPAPATLPPGVTQAGLDAFERARSAFYAGNYDQALSDIDQAAGEMPQDAATHEFRGLVLFTLGRYHEAAAPVHAVLAVGPGWDWTTMVGLYPSVDVYTAQLRALEQYVRRHANEAAARFLLAYHYITTSNTDAAVRQLREVTRLQPDDAVAAQLLRMLGGPEAQPQTAPLPTTRTTEATPDAVRLTTEDLAGEWTAAGPRGSEYRATYQENGEFRWAYTTGGKTEEIGGVFAVDGDLLALEPDSGGTLLARVTKPVGDTLHLDVAGAPQGDPGLDFRRSAK